MQSTKVQAWLLCLLILILALLFSSCSEEKKQEKSEKTELEGVWERACLDVPAIVKTLPSGETVTVTEESSSLQNLTFSNNQMLDQWIEYNARGCTSSLSISKLKTKEYSFKIKEKGDTLEGKQVKKIDFISKAGTLIRNIFLRQDQLLILGTGIPESEGEDYPEQLNATVYYRK
ncbi:hypothetical protein WDW89_17015 [Deltaproteobacteria bacterium TL4]